jgi:NDP-sugar pyrophosphorylase family protein
MKAMILAAGLGTRLRPLTDDRPKALVEINGRTLLEITLARLRSFGVSEVIINVHHFADLVVAYLQQNNNFGVRIEISREESLLDTGGGLKKAAHFFLQNSSRPDEPFILHNVDVLSAIDLGSMVKFHNEHRALATLAVQHRDTSRYLLFDSQLQLCGRRIRDEKPDLVRPDIVRTGGVRTDVRTDDVRGGDPPEALAFSGIHVISPRLLAMMTGDGAFSIITTYLRLAAQGEKILAFRADEFYWQDLGKPENLEQAANDLKQKRI